MPKSKPLEELLFDKRHVYKKLALEEIKQFLPERIVAFADKYGFYLCISRDAGNFTVSLQCLSTTYTYHGPTLKEVFDHAESWKNLNAVYYMLKDLNISTEGWNVNTLLENR
jgi:hypothetical protein